MEGKQNKELIYYLPWARRCSAVWLQESRAPSHTRVTWEDKTHNSKCPWFPPFPPSFIYWAWWAMVWNICLGSWGHLSQLCPLQTPPECTPSLLAGRVVWEAEKVLMLFKHCSEVTKTSLCYQHYFHHKSKMYLNTSYYETTLPQPKPSGRWRKAVTRP